MTPLKIVPMTFEGKTATFAFDVTYPTQAFIHGTLINGQICDPPLVSALTDFLEPGDTFLDVGSHIGYYSMLALLKVGSSGRVFAFEANPRTYSVLVANASLNRSSNLYAYNCAVGDQETIAEFHIDIKDEGMSSLLVTRPDSLNVSVHMTTLDNIANLTGIDKIRMLKIDVEGFEVNVIRGAEGLIKAGAIESIVFEVNQTIPGTKNCDLEIRRFLRQYGYTSYLVRPWIGEELLKNAFGQNNYYRIPDHAELKLNYGNILATKRQLVTVP
jgi:FkbM family methyltransferase